MTLEGGGIVEGVCQAGQPYHRMQCNTLPCELYPNSWLVTESNVR